MIRFTFSALAVTLCAALSVTAQEPAAPDSAEAQAQAKAYADMLRKDILKDKNAFFEEGMGLVEPAEKSKFWDVYGGYQKEMEGIWKQRGANIKNYAANYKTLSDPVADELATTALKNDEQSLALRKKYYETYKTVLGPKKAARWLQLESAWQHLIMLKLTTEIPLVK